MKIFVTGATGLVGNNCIRILAQEHELHVLVRKGYDPRPFERLDVRFHYGDLLQLGTLADVIPDVDAIIHSAGDTHIGVRPRPSQRVVNTLATQKIAHIACQRGVRMVFVSSVDALPAGAANRTVDEQTQGEAKFPIGYVITKREAEADLLQQIDRGLDAVIVNPGFMLGPWDWKPSSGRMLLEVASKFTPFSPNGGFSICDVRDVAAAICRIATDSTRHRRYILAGHNVTYADAWKVFAKVSSGSPPVGTVGPVVLQLAGLWGDFVGSITGPEREVNSASIGMAQLFHYYSSQRAQHELAYEIRPFEQSVGDAWAWFQQHGYVRQTD